MKNSMQSALLALAALALASCDLSLGGDDENEFQYALQFVSPAGSDSNDGLSASSPLRSIDLAVSRCASSGAAIRVAGGSYSSGAGFDGGDGIAVELRGIDGDVQAHERRSRYRSKTRRAVPCQLNCSRRVRPLLMSSALRAPSSRSCAISAARSSASWELQ